jgi:hypothetical protein
MVMYKLCGALVLPTTEHGMARIIAALICYLHCLCATLPQNLCLDYDHMSVTCCIPTHYYTARPHTSSMIWIPFPVTGIED